MITLRPGNERGHADHGWLNTYHSFSFNTYHDPKWMGFRSLRVINDDRVAAGQGFGKHPHRDMEIISYVLSGELEHKDSMGNGRIIKPGDFQYMSAGSGVLHSEFNPSPDAPAHFLQIWIEPSQKGTAPRYAEKSCQQTATGAFHLIASPSGREGSIAIHQDAELWLAKLNAGDSLAHALAPWRHAWVHVAEGKIQLNGQELGEGDGAALSSESHVNILCLSPAQVLLFDLS